MNWKETVANALKYVFSYVVEYASKSIVSRAVGGGLVVIGILVLQVDGAAEVSVVVLIWIAGITLFFKG